MGRQERSTTRECGYETYNLPTSAQQLKVQKQLHVFYFLREVRRLVGYLAFISLSFWYLLFCRSRHLLPLSSFHTTPFAKISITNESKAAKQLREQKRAEKARKLVLTPKQKAIAIGTMLGDASLQTQSKGKSWRLKYQMSARFPDYAERLCNDFGEDWIPSKPHDIKRFNSRMLGFQTLTSENLNSIADLFMEELEDGGYKKVYKPGLITEHLTNEGLAYWFMDDGGKGDFTPNEGKQIHLHTQGFTEEEVKAMCKELNQKFGLDAWAKPNKGAHVIAISGNSYEKFKELVELYLVDSMRRKLPSERKGTWKKS